MRNFPASWVAPTAAHILPAKIKHLLEKFGKLQQSPMIAEGNEGIVAIATFMDRLAAEAAAKTLHGVDNRTEAEKRLANYKPATEEEMFHVEMASDSSTEPSSASARPPVAPSSAVSRKRKLKPGEQSCRLQLASLPPEWQAQDIQELCNQYGPVDSVFPDGPGGFIVTFGSSDTAANACGALGGLQFQTETGSFSTLHCELMPEDEGGTAVEEMPEQVQEEGNAVQHASSSSNLYEGGAPLVFYIDELQLATGEPGAEDREIFLRDLPLEDYTEQQLREWLDDFGSVSEIVFIRDPSTKELTGRGYVRFASHEEANGLLAAFPQVAEDDGNVKGTWSLSERMLQGREGLFGADVVSPIVDMIRQLQEDLRCGALFFAGDSQEGGSELQALGLEAGPLHFVCSRHHRLGTPEALQAYFAEAVADVLSNPLRPRPGKSSNLDNLAEDEAAASLGQTPRTTGSAGQRGSGAAPLSSVNGSQVPGPCILVTGFPDSWQAQQVRLIFAVFGGVAGCQIVQDSEGRSARVQLKNPDNMSKAVEQLNQTQVGDGEFIEECTITCRLLGGSSGDVASSEVVTRLFFIDELEMRSRPDVAPSQSDREVFLQSLPVRDCTEEQIRAWLEGFGQVEEVQLLQDAQTGAPGGKGYVRFLSHEEAAACVEAQTSVADAEEGDVVAHWSESERAVQRGRSVYRADVHSVFAPRALDALRRGSKARNLWLYSEDQLPKDPSAPPPEARQLHFVAECTEQQLVDLKSRLAKALEDFHARISGVVSDHKGEREPARRPHERCSGDKSERSSGKRDRRSKARDCSPPPGQLWSEAPGWPPHPGYGGPPGPVDGWQAPYPSWRGPIPPPPRGVFSGPGFPPGKGGPMPPHAGPGWGAFPHGWPAPPGHPGFEPDRPPGSFPSAKPSRLAGAASTPHGADGIEARDDSVHGQIEMGEALVRDAKTLVENSGPVKKAYEKYCEGLQSLLEVMPKLPEDDPNAADLRMRVDGYLEEAEKLKTRLDAEGGRGAVGAAGERNVRVPRALGRDGEQGRNKADGASRQGSGTKADAGTRVDKKADEMVKKATGVWSQAAVGGQALVQRLERGEALIHEGQEAEDAKLLDEAYEKYCMGLQLVLEAMPQLPDDYPQVASLKQKVSSYLERAERLKERLANTTPAGVRQRGTAQDSKRSSNVGDHGGGGRARSRSRHRHKRRSPSRSRSRRHGVRDRRRSHSRSRGGRKEAAPLPPATGSRTAQSSGRGIVPAPPPVGRSVHPSKAAGVPPDRFKTNGPPRPSGPAAPLLRPKSGNALLVGKAKASVKR